MGFAIFLLSIGDHHRQGDDDRHYDAGRSPAPYRSAASAELLLVGAGAGVRIFLRAVELFGCPPLLVCLPGMVLNDLN